MNLTEEQVNILNSDEDIKINAVAGSGKTTTLIEYARTRPVGSKILYLVFNRSVKLEAINKFANKGLTNVTVETAHSLAYRDIVVNYRYKVSANGYKINEIAEILDLASDLQGQEKITQYIIANHINKFVALFCNSDKRKVQDLNYLDIVSDPKAKSFVKFYYTIIENKTRQFLSKMDRGEIEIIHDFYLKKFQLSNPILHYDYILFDEGQDASPAMLDVFIKQNAKKVIVGDTHQQIYGWRYAVNSLEKSNFKSFNLSLSFRFSQDIANLAISALDLKSLINDEYKTVSITGKGNSDKKQVKSIIARTNLGLLVKAIKYLKSKKVKYIYFEGNISSYTYADEGASLYDVLNLYNKKYELIRDVMIKGMKDIEELQEYIESTEDVQLGMMLDIVMEYGNEIHSIIKEIKDKNHKKEDAEMIFSTVHRCKGMEYDSIELVDDFITEKRLKKIVESQKDDKNEKKRSPVALNEEINLLYVAITRTKNIINIPEELVPRWLPHSKQINIISKPIVVDNSSKLRDKIYGKLEDF